MKYLLLLTIFLSNPLTAEGFFSKNNSKDIEKHSKLCIGKANPMHKAMFLKEELCRFGSLGCDGVVENYYFEVLCELEKASECYAKKSWYNRNQFFNLSQNLTISNISHTVSFKQGRKTDELCAYYK